MTLADVEANRDAAQMADRWNDLTPEQQDAERELLDDWLRETHPDVYFAVPATAPKETTMTTDPIQYAASCAEANRWKRYEQTRPNGVRPFDAWVRRPLTLLAEVEAGLRDDLVDVWGDDELPPPDEFGERSQAISDAGDHEFGRAA